MAVGTEYAPFIGEWDVDTLYSRGDVVYLDDAAYQANADTIGQDPSDGWPSWTDVTAIPIALQAEIDPTSGDGVVAALGSTFVDPTTGVYFKTDDTATDWTIIEAAA